MNNEIVTYSVLNKYVTGNWESVFISLIFGYGMERGIAREFG